ncbi:hypothetical protein BDW74DRAFT_55593 [Aspergillus multicolor]|uniref:uncharacterized protein n=1 Tax=Aspergillus multicolor TaxID=41759 RepID=UPI003CCD5528
MESETVTRAEVDYNEVLFQMSTNLNNALVTYGPSSTQYQTVLEMLKDCMHEVDKIRSQGSQDIDPDVLSVAMGFLEIRK